MKKFAVLGAGSWGTALVKILLEDPEVHIDWWVRNQQAAEFIGNHGSNPKYLRSVKLDTNRLTTSTELSEVIEHNEVLILVTPSAFVYDLFHPLDNTILQGKKVISAVKGVIPQTLQILGDYFFTDKELPIDQFGVITGPCHAEEVAQERLSYLTFASTNKAFSEQMAQQLNADYIRCTASADIYGTEITAVLKNVYAIAAGMSHHLGYGDNFQAVLVSNAIREIKRFIAAVHPIDRDTDGSAYLGDLLVTAYSQYSRNRTLGSMLGKGYSVRSALMEMEMVAEGYYATESIHELNKKYKVDMPILDFVYKVIYQKAHPKSALAALTGLLN